MRRAAVAWGLVWVLAAQAQDVPTPEELARYMELARPGPEHELLRRLEGSWELQIKVWPHPEQDPVVMPGRCENRMILGGRFLQCASGDTAEHPEGYLALMGFDRRKERYTIVNLDTQGTYWVTAEGTWDADQEVLRLQGEDQDLALQHTQRYEFRLHLLAEDKYITEIYFSDPTNTHGEERFKAVEIVHTRHEPSVGD